MARPAAGRIDNVPASKQVSVLMHAPAAAIRERIDRWATIDDLGAGRCRLHMVSDALEWPMMALGIAGADFEVLAPPELVDHVRDWGERFGRAARRSSPI